MKKHLLLLSLLLVMFGACKPSAEPNSYTINPMNEYCVDSTYEVQYIDTLVDCGQGFRTRIELCLPVGEGPWPVAVMRCPYFPEALKIIDSWPDAKAFASRGIAYLVQRNRGTGGSEGQFVPNVYEREDGHALLNWLTQQSWCGDIGLHGVSYMGLCCWIIADSLPEQVKGIHLQHYGIDRHLSAYHSGMFRQDILTSWAIENAREPITRPTRDSVAPYYKEERHMPQATMDEDLLGSPLPWYREWITHTDHTDPYWHQGVWETLRNIPPKIDVPMTIVAGHFDHHNEGTILGYELLKPETKAKSRLIVGSWDHSFNTTPIKHQPQHDHDYLVDIDKFNWLYSILVEHKEPQQEVMIYTIGADEWVNLKEWPADTSESIKLYLTTQPSAHGQSNLLSLTPPKEVDTTSFIYDPQQPVLTVGGETLFQSEKRRGSIEQPEMGYRSDVLFYESESLTEPLTIDGRIKGHIRMSSNVDDTAICFKVSEEWPNGSAVNIRTGMATLAYRKDRLKPRETYTPGDVVEVDIETLPIRWTIREGHRVRIDITSSNFPEYSIHSNYAGIWSLQTKTRIAEQKIYIGGDNSSYIELPVTR